MNPLVSVVIPNYNYARYLRECVDSVLAQTYKSFEVIVVDDGSSDESVSILQSYGGRIRWFQQKNTGVSAARNLGIQKANGEFVAFLDADDSWMPEKLEIQVPKFVHEEIGVVYCGVERVSVDGEVLSVSDIGSEGDVLADIVLFTQKGDPAFATTTVIRKTALEKVGGFDPNVSTSADWDIWRRLSASYRTVFVPRPLARYRQHGSNMHRNILLLEHDCFYNLSNTFADPLCSRIFKYRRRAFGRANMILSGAHYQQGNLASAFAYGLKAIAYSPREIAYILKLPIRKVRAKTPLRAVEDKRPELI